MKAALFIFFLAFLSPRVYADACSDIKKAEEYAKVYPSDASKKQVATAYNNCGVAYGNQKKWNSAERYLQKARQLDPSSAIISQSLANVIGGRGMESFQNNDLRAAKDDLQKALRYDPKNGDIKVALSQVLYRLESKTSNVEKLYKEGRGEDAQNQQYGREAEMEKQSLEDRQGNWIVRYQESLAQFKPDDFFKTLQDVSDRVGDDFRYWIKHPLVIVLTDEATFQKIHMGPDWAGALNDGRIKVPVGGNYVTPEKFKSVLAHEYTHSVINDLAHLNFVPFWIHEGLAQYEETRIVPDAHQFRILPLAFGKGYLIPMTALSDPNVQASLNSSQAALAYEQALSFVLFLKETYRIDSVVAVINRLGEGKSVQEAVTSGIGRNLSFLDEEWKVWLGKQFPH